MKIRKIILGICIHCTISWVLWGGMRVYQRGYNAMHTNQLAMASISISDETAEIQVLRQQLSLPAAWFSEDSPLYTAAYCLTGEDVHFWLYLTAQLQEWLAGIQIEAK